MYSTGLANPSIDRKSRNEHVSNYRSVSPAQQDVNARIYQHVRAKSYSFLAQQEEPHLTKFETQKCGEENAQFHTLNTAQILSRKLESKVQHDKENVRAAANIAHQKPPQWTKPVDKVLQVKVIKPTRNKSQSRKIKQGQQTQKVETQPIHIQQQPSPRVFVVQSNVCSLSNLGTTSGGISCAQLLDTVDRRAMKRLHKQRLEKLTHEAGVLSLEIVQGEGELRKEAGTEPLVLQDELTEEYGQEEAEQFQADHGETDDNDSPRKFISQENYDDFQDLLKTGSQNFNYTGGRSLNEQLMSEEQRRIIQSYLAG